jgi:hypothetical protein
MTGVTDAAARSLSGKVKGQVLLPGDAGYDRARAVWNSMVDRRPRPFFLNHNIHPTGWQANRT